MKRTLEFGFVVVCFFLVCGYVNAQSLYWWNPWQMYQNYSYGNSGDCKNGMCNLKKGEAEAKPEEAKKEAKEDSEAVKSPEKVEPVAEELIVPTPADKKEEIEETVVALQINPFTEEVVKLINEHRASRKLPPLILDNTLILGCANHSAYMANGGGFQHSIDNYGRECIAMGISSPEALVNMWMISIEQRNILMGQATSVGIGSAGQYHTLRVR